jgi:small-conductance mechanosensitive channel
MPSTLRHDFASLAASCRGQHEPHRRAGHWCLWPLLGLVLLAGPGAVLAAEPEELASVARAPVSLDGRVISELRGVSAYPAERRAQDIGARLKALAADRSMPIDAIQVIVGEDRHDIRAGELRLLSLYDADAELEGIPRAVLGEAIRQKIVEAVEAYRHERTPGALLAATAYALGATLAAALVLFALLRGFRGLYALIERRLQARIEELEARSQKVIQVEQVASGLRSALRVLQIGSVVALAVIWAQYVLYLYPWTRPLAERVLALILDPLRTIGLGIAGALPNLVFLLLLFFLTRFTLRTLRLGFSGIDRGTVKLAGFDPEWAWPTYRVARLLVVAFAIVVAYPYIPGSDSAAFKGISLFLGVIFSLGSSSIIANLIAGYSMTYRRTFRIGDRIQVGDLSGDVVEAGLMVTRLKSVKNEELVIPNSLILNGSVVNYSTRAREQGLILHTTVGIGYETPWRQVEAMLLLAAGRTPGLLKDPSPFVLQTALGDFCITYEINAYCDNAQAMARLYHHLHQSILDVFNEYGVQIMTPAYERDPPDPKVVPRDRWYAPPAASS